MILIKQAFSLSSSNFQMSLTAIKSDIQQRFNETLGNTTNEIRIDPVGGGCINQTYRISCGDQQFFCKINSASKFPQLFEKESQW